MPVYMLHFEPSYKGVSHYVGYSANAQQRIKAHLNQWKTGSGLVSAALDAGCDVKVANIWPKGGRELELRIKRQRNHKRFCAICSKKTQTPKK